MVIGAAGMSVCFFVVAGTYANLPPPTDSSAKAYGIVAVSFIYIYFAFFSSTWLAPNFVFAAEILPLKGRTTGMSLGISEYSHEHPP
jgi:hypothetical protein